MTVPDFASDFGFDLAEVESLFECDLAHPLNAAMLELVRGLSGASPEPSGGEDPLIGDSLPVLKDAILMNSGLEAELAVASEMIDQGWAVKYTGDQPLLGYDLRAQKDDFVLHIEVKSSIGFTTPELTSSEWAAAKAYSDSYVIAIVDFVGGDRQTIWYVRDPAESIEPNLRVVESFRLARSSIEALRTEVDFL